MVFFDFIALVNWADIENCLDFLSNEMPDIKIDDNPLFEEIRRLNVYLNTDKLQQWENQHFEIDKRVPSHLNEKQHYLSHDIQNELIALMSKSVIEEIIHRVKQAKCYAFLLDCTRDASRVEQMSIILKFCNSSTGAIEEHFFGFIAFAETTGEYITNSILQELERNGLNIQNCRGQGYDNGANMVGINKVVRTRILNINPRAFFTRCADATVGICF
ncbi:zinc finger MYM-type protein 1 [Trichonephila clavipes]|uniref:Zinc finger MYM-type protein 1 n=1 Tax=Trichonephila clavipes TaxID=2585209 RepID=A0A8X6RXQ9_TRICX|nr:zinc finger MYM-type protein 1 [Trichonephila clavipes]